MKKFLTVLLALSVVFTYTVGTAFAVTDPVTYSAAEVESKLNTVISTYETSLNGNIGRVVDLYDLDDTDAEGYDVKVKQDAIKAAAAEFIKEVVDDMKEVVAAEVAEADKGGYDAEDLEAAKAKIEACVKAYGETGLPYKEVTGLTVAQSVTDYFTLADEKYTAATGNAVADTTYYEKTSVKSPVVEDIGDYYYLDGDAYVKESNPALQERDGGYVTFAEKSGIVYGDDVSTYFTDTDLQTAASGKAQPETKYYTANDAYVAGVDLTNITAFKATLDASIYIAKAEAPKAEAYYIAKIAKDYPISNYPAEGSFTYDEVKNLTAQEAVEAIKADAEKAIKEAKETLAKIKTPAKADYTTAIAAYKTAFDSIGTKIATLGIQNNEDLEDGKTAVEIALNAAISAMRAYALGDYTDAVWDGIETPKGTGTVALTQIATEYAGSDIYVEKTATKSATLFGVEVKDIAKATRAEVLAVKSAYLKAVNDTVDSVKKAVEAKNLTTAKAVTAEVEGYFKSASAVSQTTFTKTVKGAYTVASVYDAVVARGDALKKAVSAGEKLYDDAKVDEVVKAAETLVYKDMGKSGVDEYFKLAINKVYSEDYDTYEAALTELLLPGDFEYDKLVSAIKDAKDKFQDRVITIGSNATPETDKKYCKNYYAVDATNAEKKSYGALYEEIKEDALNALDEAQSYDDITSAMNTADAELAKLMLAADKTSVDAARITYTNALTDYAEEMQDIKGLVDYSLPTYTDALDAGKKLVADAVTVDGVTAAYAEAKALFNTLKTDKELTEMKTAIETELNALPLASSVTAADAEKIEAARASYDAYIDTFGTADLSLVTVARLTNAELALYALERDALNAEIKAMQDKLAKIDKAAADVAVEELLALKDEMSALAEKAEAFNDKMEEKEIKLSVDANKIVEKLTLAEGSVWEAEVYLTEIAINKVLKDGTMNADDVNAAFNAYKALTDRQQYKVDKDTKYAIKLIEAKVIASVESLKIKASSKLYKGKKIRVNWRVADGDASMITGYQIYKSTKMNSGYKFMGKTSKSYMDNKKNLKKGKRYFYKVRAYIDVDGERYFSDWSNKANRYYK
ncbi:Uncharacterised protein [uncultured Eubacterium sp.]|nr:Uncharacterised protein [uncultured Eubacterium sp.]